MTFQGRAAHCLPSPLSIRAVPLSNTPPHMSDLHGALDHSVEGVRRVALAATKHEARGELLGTVRQHDDRLARQLGRQRVERGQAHARRPTAAGGQ